MPLPALLIALALAEPGPRPELLTADLDGDGARERIGFYAAADGSRGFLADAGGARTSPIYPAWKAAVGRLEGGRDLVVLGTWTTKRTRPGEAPRRSIWVVGLDGGRWVERWRGSALARPFEDFTLRDLDGDGLDELVVRECRGSPAKGSFTAYAWQGFGFEGKARSAELTRCGPVDWRRLKMTGGRLWLGD